MDVTLCMCGFKLKERTKTQKSAWSVWLPRKIYVKMNDDRRVVSRDRAKRTLPNCRLFARCYNTSHVTMKNCVKPMTELSLCASRKSGVLASESWREAWRPSPKVDPRAFSGQRQGWKTTKRTLWQCTASVCVAGVHCWEISLGLADPWNVICLSCFIILGFSCMCLLRIVS